MMAYEGSESTCEKIFEFIYQLRLKIKALVRKLFGFYGILTLVSYLTPNPFL